jgi:hypothetical protein
MIADEIVSAVGEAFSETECFSVLQALERVVRAETMDSESQVRIQYAVLRLARGRRDRLEQALLRAERDWRDVLVAAGLEMLQWRDVVATTPREHISCPSCEPLDDSRSLSSQEVMQLVGVLRKRIARGTLSLVARDTGHQFALTMDGPLPAVLDQTVRCRVCRREFRLIANPGGGTGGAWSRAGGAG